MTSLDRLNRSRNSICLKFVRYSRISDKLETYAVSRAIKAIERCHITLLMIDATQPVAHQDARLAALIAERGRGCVLLMNRWDEVRQLPERNVRVVNDEIETSLPHLSRKMW